VRSYALWPALNRRRHSEGPPHGSKRDARAGEVRPLVRGSRLGSRHDGRVVRSDTADKPLTQSPIADEAYGSVLVFHDPDNLQLEFFAPAVR